MASTSGRRPDGKKQPIHFRLEDGGAFGFAGLWTCKTDDQGELVESCTIITTSPNELVAPVHDRMPVILPIALESGVARPGDQQGTRSVLASGLSSRGDDRC
jgi:putative SOS response-associated peptidase YedK